MPGKGILFHRAICICSSDNVSCRANSSCVPSMANSSKALICSSWSVNSLMADALSIWNFCILAERFIESLSIWSSGAKALFSNRDMLVSISTICFCIAAASSDPSLSCDNWFCKLALRISMSRIERSRSISSSSFVSCL